LAKKRNFLTEAWVVVRHPWTFPERLGLGPDNLFGKGAAFVVLASAVAYLLCIPIFLRHELAVSKGVMVLLHIVGLYVYGVALHLILKLMGSRGVTLKETLGLYGYQLGIQTVGFTLMLYPSLWAYRQVALSGLGGETKAWTDVPTPFLFNFLGFLFIGLVWWFASMGPMYARYHHLGRWGKTRVAAAFILAITIFFPVFNWAMPWLYKVGKFL
jgi:hypothetical protein